MVFVANDKASEVLQPSEEAFDFPSPLVSTQRSSILRRASGSVRTVRGDQLYAMGVEEPLVEGVTVIGLVADQALGKTLGPRAIEGVFNQGHFMRRSTGHVHGERKTAAVCDCHDLAALAPLGLSDVEPPFLAPAKEPSIKASERSMPPRSSRSFTSVARISWKTPARVHCWKRRWQVWYDGYRSGRSFHGAPVRRTHRIPFSTSRGSRGGRPRHPRRHFGFGISPAIRFHCSSVSSMYPESATHNSHSNHF